MVRPLAQRGDLLSLLLLARLAGVVGGNSPNPGRDYSVAALRQRLATQPVTWVGRTMLLRASAEPYPWWGAAECLRQCTGRLLVLAGAPLPLMRLAAPAPADQGAQVARGRRSAAPAAGAAAVHAGAFPCAPTVTPRCSRLRCRWRGTSGE
jgi:hypothetical protein